MKKKVLKKIKGKQRLNNLRPGAKHTLVNNFGHFKSTSGLQNASSN